MHSSEASIILNNKSKYHTNEYFLTYHKLHGCQVQKKFTKLGLFNNVANRILCFVRSFKGYEFNLQSNITKLVEESKTAPANKTKEINKLLVFASHVVKDKKADLSPCIKQCAEAQKQLFINLAHNDQKLAYLDNKDKNKLFCKLLTYNERELAEKLLVKGADPSSAQNALLVHLPHFLANPNSKLHKYIIFTTDSGKLRLEKPKPNTITRILYDLCKNDKSTDPKLFSDSAKKCLMLVNSKLEYLSSHDCITNLIVNLRSLERLVTKNDKELSSEINTTCVALLHTAAEFSNTTALDYALEYKLLDEACVLLEQGADSDLTYDERNDLFEQFMVDKNYNLARVLFDRGINLADFEDNDEVEERLSSFLQYCIQNKHVQCAQNLILSDCPTGPAIHGHFYDANALCCAVSYGLIPLVETIHSIGTTLKVTDKDDKTLLHLALEKGQFEMADWLSERLDVRATTKKGRTAYVAVADLEYITTKPALEQAFLLNDLKKVNKLVATMTSEQFAQELKNLQKKYPATRIEDFFYQMNPVHLKKVDVVKVPDTIAKGFTVRHLLAMANQLNFTKPDGPFYINPELLSEAEGGVSAKIEDIKAQLEICVERIEKRKHFQGTPPKKSAEIELFYSMIERAITNTLKLINEMKTDTEEQQKKKQERIQTAMTEYIKAAYVCGGRLYSVSCSQFVAASKGRDQTFEEDIAQILADFRDMLLQSLIPARDDNNEENEHSVHDYNLLVYHLGEKLGIPGYNMLSEFHELYIGVGVSKQQKEKEFFQKYTSAYIIFDSIKMTLEQTNEYKDKTLDWFKTNLPKDYKKAHFDAIRRELKTIPADKQKAYLQSKDIYPEPGMTMEQGIENERVSNYLAEEVIVDMNSPTFQIQPSALAYMLTKMNILKRV
ncbi:MAG: ankyrin repeat domain-containing protein [Chlamydiales bacterium]|nr:ankyrin repeat domain-containing protein [Chlamydiales bacterium]